MKQKHSKKLDDEEVIDMCLKFYTMRIGIHGESHIRNVVKLAKRISRRECPQYTNDVIVGAALHDVGRRDDFGGNEHAVRGSRIAKGVIKSYWPNLHADKIVEAIKYHTGGLTTSDPLIGSIWDADRLDLVRLGKRIDISLLSTKTAKKILEELSE